MAVGQSPEAKALLPWFLRSTACDIVGSCYCGRDWVAVRAGFGGGKVARQQDPRCGECLGARFKDQPCQIRDDGSEGRRGSCARWWNQKDGEAKCLYCRRHHQDSPPTRAACGANRRRWKVPHRGRHRACGSLLGAVALRHAAAVAGGVPIAALIVALQGLTLH